MDSDECLMCGTWVCSRCHWRRTRANLHFAQYCPRCGSTEGTLTPTRHSNVSIRKDHNHVPALED